MKRLLNRLAVAWIRRQGFMVVPQETMDVDAILDQARHSYLSPETWADLDVAQDDPEEGRHFRRILGTSR